MEMTGEYRLAAPREAVWAALNDPEILRRCIPGCETIERLSDTELTARVAARIGPVSAKFSGKVTLADLDPPNGYRLTGEGTGGPAGFAKGGARVTLAEEDGATVLRYAAEASVGGKLAQIGSRLIDATAKKLADEFFASFAEIVGTAPPAVPLGESTAEAVATVPAAETPPAPTPSLPPAIWVPALIVIVGLIMYLFAR